MKIAITSLGKDLDSEIDPRFGRAAHILIIDTEQNKVDVIDNSENIDAFKGAGIQAAALLSKKGAKILMTGYCGPNAFKTLQAAGIRVVSDVTGTVKGALDAFANGELSFSESANAKANW
ncbi:MAG: NifB/NifX family molybdenum-iron cluster-binding protein [Desulfobacterales bacterium]|nr:NifB/NifX family molybdenum-iron cluster-binding protein [Desulfobacterales bacterium]